jgi:4-carboxymuconolactone decarboxylase
MIDHTLLSSAVAGMMSDLTHLTNGASTMTDDERYAQGIEIMKQLFGEVPKASEVHEDLMEVATRNLFGDIWTRPHMEIRERSMVTCALLAALGRDQQLKGHMKGALNVGISRETMKELMLHVAHYAGFSSGVQGLSMAKEVFDELDGV